MEQLQSHIWLTASSYMGKYFFAFPHILGSHSSYMTLQLLHSEFHNVGGKFSFLFYQCRIRGLQRDVVYLGWPIAPSSMNPNVGEGVGVPGSQPKSTAVHRSPNKLCRSYSIFKLWSELTQPPPPTNPLMWKRNSLRKICVLLIFPTLSCMITNMRKRYTFPDAT